MAKAKAESASNSQDLARYKRMFDEARTDQNKVLERQESLIDRDYYDGHQLTPA